MVIVRNNLPALELGGQTAFNSLLQIGKNLTKVQFVLDVCMRFLLWIFFQIKLRFFSLDGYHFQHSIIWKQPKWHECAQSVCNNCLKVAFFLQCFDWMICTCFRKTCRLIIMYLTYLQQLKFILFRSQDFSSVTQI